MLQEHRFRWGTFCFDIDAGFCRLFEPSDVRHGRWQFYVVRSQCSFTGTEVGFYRATDISLRISC